jgi:RNA polymerase sigma-70 factor (ECF subfamily)
MSNDNELILHYKHSKDPEHLGRLYERYIDLVYGVCMKYLSSHEDAQDAVIDIYVELMSKLLKHEVSFFKGWLYQLSCNHCLMKLRKRKSGTTIISMEFMQNEVIWHPDEVLEKEMKLNSMEDCLQQLQEKQKTAVMQFYLEGKCYQEISRITGEEPGKVRSQIQNGKRNLKICMERSNP